MIKLVAKKVKRIRALVGVMEELGYSSSSSYYRNKKKELEITKEILGLMIKGEKL